MANSKISGLSSASTPLAGTETLPIVQSGATVKVPTNDLTVRNIRAAATTGILQISGPTAGTTRTATVPDANWTAARTDAAQSFTGDQTLSTGNLVQGTAAKGVNFTANTPAAGMTSRLLNWYEEGTWTPVITVTGGSITQAIQGTPKFTRSGRLVNASGYVNISSVNLPTGTVKITGLPYASATFAAATLALFTGGFTASYSGHIDNAGTFVTVTNFNAATLVGGENLIFSITYPTT